jgi:hypothetical protein
MRKIIMLMVIVSMLFGGTSAFAAAGDTPSTWATAEVKRGIETGIVPERLQSKYQTAITREEFAELIVNAVFANNKQMYSAGGLGEEFYWTAEKVLDRVTLEVEFEDAKQDHVKIAYILGSINGVSDTKFAPNNKITREEAAMMLINTSHISNGMNYAPNSSLGYADFDTISDWAKPAVQGAWAVGYMKGEGNKFNPKGNITREQAIATVMRLYERTHTFAIRGNLIAYPQYNEIRYTVGKNYIIADFEDDGVYSKLDEDMWKAWERDPTLNEDKVKFTDTKTAVAVLGFQSVLKPRSIGKGALEPTAAGKNNKWDYGYMTVSFFDKDGLVKFEYKNIPGYMTLLNGYNYGYPFKEVSVSPILN